MRLKMSFRDKLAGAVAKNNSLLCVGLDPALDKLPRKYTSDQLFDFNKQIIDSTADVVCAFKPNSAFYEASGAAGIAQLKQTCDYINQQHPQIPIILDAKRADIGNTNIGYAQYAFDYLGADAITLQPYLGGEALEPFLKYHDKGLIILCRTSNPGAGEFQDLKVNGKKLYQVIAEEVRDKWNKNGNCLLVVGATYPRELAEIRQIAGDEMVFLVPGVGAQGGDVEKTVKSGANKQGEGIIINSSSAIIFASSGDDFAGKARQVATMMRDEINKVRELS
jgi:orotidine-5'-phosphate decarboxylase